MAVEQLLAAFHQACLLSEEHLLCALGFCGTGFHGCFESGFDHCRTFGSEGDELVEVLDLPLDIVDVDG
ncbi:hypothetical protein [Microbacterium sp. AG157]|uniref:hypothetical protein n=1 Tax=Microbacterium sp. AG157 TaxID=2183993 RepID=UPI000E224DD5|nr:hypothetical protein [Microbacterium sp. AG157]